MQRIYNFFLGLRVEPSWRWRIEKLFNNVSCRATLGYILYHFGSLPSIISVFFL